MSPLRSFIRMLLETYDECPCGIARQDCDYHKQQPKAVNDPAGYITIDASNYKSLQIGSKYKIEGVTEGWEDNIKQQPMSGGDPRSFTIVFRGVYSIKHGNGPHKNLALTDTKLCFEFNQYAGNHWMSQTWYSFAWNEGQGHFLCTSGRECGNPLKVNL